MELNINTPAYFNQHYGIDDEVYRFCQNAYMYFKDKEYSDTLHTIGIAPVAETKDTIYLGSDLPDEYSNSNYTACLKGTMAKAKANAVQGIPEMIKTATNRRFQENQNEKHAINAKRGWYRYDSRFELSVCADNGEILRYNIFQVELV